ncbi:autotransporter outer membrane beta-barrel domain-containing protein [Camelimonas sp. ID_303_24]
MIETGTSAQAEAVNVMGYGNTVLNYGLIQATSSAAIWFQDAATGSKNTVDNYGTIERVGGTGSVIGASGNNGINFYNRTNATVIGGLSFANGNDDLYFEPGSKVTGTINGGGGTNNLTLQGAAGSHDTLPGHVTNFTTLTKDGPGQWTMSGSLTGFTIVTVRDGTLTLTGNNAGYTGSAIVNPTGILEARAQSLPVKTNPADNLNNIQNNGLLRFTQPAGDDAPYIGQIVGTGAVEKTGGGMVTLAPVAPAGNTYSGGTVIKGGVLAANADSAIGAPAGGITLDGGAFGFASSFTLGAGRPVTVTSNNGGLYAGAGVTGTVTQGITGPGAITKSGDGAVVLTGANTYGGGTTIAAGALQLGNGGTTGSIVGDVANNGALIFNRADAVTFPGTISGSGNVQQVGAGTTILTANNTYTGGTTIAAGALQLGNGGTTGSIVGDVVNNGALIFNRADAVTFPGTISGSGNVQQVGAGTTILTANNTYTGGTTIAAGALQLGNGGTTGSIVGDVVNNGALIFNRADTVTFPGTISGSGNVQQVGAGTTILTANNTYTGGTTIAAGALQLGNGGTTGSIVGDVANNGALIFNRADTVTFPGTISGSGNVRQIGAGTTILTANNTYAGVTSVERGGLAVGNAAHPGAALSGGGPVNVAAGATFGGYGSVAGNVVNNGTIAVADAFPGFTGGPGGNFTIGGVVTNAGHAQIGGGAVGNNLVVGSWVGQNGVIGVNTVLGGDNSPSDRLVINGGSATGGSAIVVTNAGGLGAITWGNGIQVVSAQNGATTSAGAFTLARPAVAGPYEYTLYRGARDSSDRQSWYLRTDLPPVPPTPEPAPMPEPGPTPTPGPAPTPGLPNYRQETSLYAALPSMALGYGQSILGTLHERVGEQELLRGRQSANGPSFVNGVWGRIIGQHVSQSTSAGGIYGRGPAYDQDVAAFQLGLDLYRRQHADGSRDHAGVYFVVGQSEGSVKHFTGARAGQNRFDAQTIGAYWTHFGATGWYVDAVAQGTWYNAKASSTRLMQLSPDGFGVGLSLEAGYPVQLGGGWIVEPQAQLIYQSISLDSRYDGAAQVRFSDAQSLAGRIGARLSRTWTLDAENGPKQINVWARANLWNEFLGNPKTWFSSADGFVPFRSDMKGAWTQLGGGVTAQLNGNVALYADASYNIGHGGDRRSWDGKVGVRVNW